MWHFKGCTPKKKLVYTGHRRNSANWPNGILICSAEQRKTRVANYYKLDALLKKFVHEKRLWNNVWVMLNLFLTVYMSTIVLWTSLLNAIFKTCERLVRYMALFHFQTRRHIIKHVLREKMTKTFLWVLNQAPHSCEATTLNRRISLSQYTNKACPRL